MTIGKALNSEKKEKPLWYILFKNVSKRKGKYLSSFGCELRESQPYDFSIIVGSQSQVRVDYGLLYGLQAEDDDSLRVNADCQETLYKCITLYSWMTSFYS